MAIEKREYSGNTNDELRQIAVANSGDPKVLAKIKRELEFRDSSAATKLLNELDAGGPISPPVQSKSRGTTETSTAIHRDCEVLEASYELLRATFSEKGEILSRWGITESIPDDLLAKIASLWIEKFKSGYKHIIRSQEQLSKDCQFLGIVLPIQMKDL